MNNIVVNVILVALALSLALTIVFWAVSIVYTNLGIEIFEIKKKNIIKSSDIYIVSLELENKGTSPVKIINVLINNKLPSIYNAEVNISKTFIQPGETVSLEIRLRAKAGTLIEISINTEKGIKHIATLRLE